MNTVTTTRADRGYEKAARIDPYYAVIPFPQFRRSQLSEEHLQEFFAIGEQHIENVISTIRKHFAPDFTPHRVLDYGCGTGRLVIPLSRRAERVVGVDISPSMLSETRVNCDRFGVDNVELVLADDNLTRVTGKFDLIHSTIVFQHVPAKRVEKIVRGLIPHLEPGGFGSLHFLFWSPAKMRIARFVKRTIPFGNAIANRLKGRPRDFGYIDLHPLSMDRIATVLCEGGAREIWAEFHDWKAKSDDRTVHVTFRCPGG
ncbi:MAG: class I SAM-dependent methyltransferase [Candidatus Binatus sp.]